MVVSVKEGTALHGRQSVCSVLAVAVAEGCESGSRSSQEPIIHRISNLTLLQKRSSCSPLHSLRCHYANERGGRFFV